MKNIFTIIFISLISASIFAQISSPEFTHFTNKEGLSSSYVKGIQQDKLGFIWIATREDISRFEGNHFVNFPAYDVLGNPINIEPQSLSCINDSIILLESMQNFHYYFDYGQECFKPYTPLFSNLKKECLTTLPNNTLAYIQDNSIYTLNIIDKKVVLSDLFKKFDKQAKTEDYLKIDANDNVIVAYTSIGRVLLYHFKTKKISVVATDVFKASEVTFLKVDKHNNIWIGLYANGLVKFNFPSCRKTYFSTDTHYKLPHKMVHCVTLDNQNRAWIGTENGLCIWDESNNEFRCFEYDIRKPKGLNTNPIYNSFTDKDGNIWLGTYFGGINLWCNKSTKFTYWEPGTSEDHLGGKVVSCFYEDKNHNIWIGTEDMGVNKISSKTGHIEKVTEQLTNSNLSYKNVHDLLLVDQTHLWIATYSGGINVLNNQNNQITCFQVKDYPLLASDFVYALTQQNNLIYIGTNSGISVYDKNTKKFSRFFEQIISNEVIVSFAWKNKTLWICSYDNVYSYNTISGQLLKHEKLSAIEGFGQVLCDSKGYLWLTTNNRGLIRYDENKETIQFFNKETGFPTNRIFSIESADNQTIWASTNNGIIHLNPEDNSFIHYDSNAGVPFNQFNYRAAFKSSDGIIYFGGNEGMVSINTDQYYKISPANVQLTHFLLFNKLVTPDNDAPIKTSIVNATEIELEHNENVFTIQYSSIDYTNNGKISYAYKMDGFDNDFNYVGNQNSATYTNLDPGNYTFYVKASNDAWVSESPTKKIFIHIKPPIWLTPYAFFAYAIIFLAIVFVLNFISVKMQRSKSDLALERQERMHNEEINNFKLEFFTNISHEIKTPLSLILGPLSSLLENEKLNQSTQSKLSRIYINVSRLNNLLGELLEFRRIDKESVNFRVYKQVDLSFVKNIKEAFKCIAEHRNINFTATYDQVNTEVWINKAVIEKIIFNLLSNSFKYCNPNDFVHLNVSVENNDEFTDYLNISVKDSGPGISKYDLNKVLNRFYQSSKAKKVNNGTGIGLSYVNNLVNMHKGKLSIESEPNEGTLIKIWLPCTEEFFDETEISHEIQEEFSITENTLSAIDEQTEKDQIIIDDKDRVPILIVEDNIELLEFLSESLIEYNIKTAQNGKEALELVKTNNFDLIISDVMMPEMDGLELTQILKSAIETSHIPIVLLTAKTGLDNIYEGLKHGADIYLEKPFLPQILKQNILNIINTRKNAIQRFSSNPDIAPTEVTTSSRDKEFIEELTTLIEENLDNPEMDVQFIIGKLHVSRSLLHIKLKSILNCSTTEYIRIIRLKKAIDFIAKENCSFSEAAYKTGFTSLTYFSRAFKNQYGKSPREYFQQTER